MKKSCLVVLSFSFLTIILYSCNNSNRNVSDINVKEILINIKDVKDVKDEVDISPYLEDDFDIIALETNDDCLLSDPIRIIYHQDWILVAEQITQSIYLFDNEGKYLRTIGNQGRGPGEYLQINDICVIGNDVYVAEKFIKDKLVRYSLDGGVGFDIDYGDICFDEMFPLGDQVAFFTRYTNCSPTYYNLLIFDLETREITPKMPFDGKIAEGNSVWGLNRYASQYKDTTLLAVPTNDTIFAVTKDNIDPRYIVKFSGKNLPSQLKHKEASEILMAAMDDDYITGVNRICNSKNYMLIDYFEGIKRRSLIYNKQTYKYEIGGKFVIENVGSIYCSSYDTTSDDEFIIFEDADMFKRVWDGRYSRRPFKNNQDKERIQKIADNLDEYSNPVIMRFKFK